MLIQFEKSVKVWMLCAFGAMALFSSATYAQNTELKQVFAQLGSTPVVRANFEQQKKLASLNKTYISKGEVLFSKNVGVLWKIQFLAARSENAIKMACGKASSCSAFLSEN